jgi:hypothetical protein
LIRAHHTACTAIFGIRCSVDAFTPAGRNNAATPEADHEHDRHGNPHVGNVSSSYPSRFGGSRQNVARSGGTRLPRVNEQRSQTSCVTAGAIVLHGNIHSGLGIGLLICAG